MRETELTPTAAAHSGTTLASQLLAPETLPALLADCGALVAAEVARRGVAIRTAFNVVHRVRPDLVGRALRELMPEFVAAIEPLYAEFSKQDGGDLQASLVAHDAQVADALLSVSDRRAARLQSKPVRAGYQRLRGRARRELIASMPAISRVIARYAG